MKVTHEMREAFRNASVCAGYLNANYGTARVKHWLNCDACLDLALSAAISTISPEFEEKIPGMEGCEPKVNKWSNANPNLEPFYPSGFAGGESPGNLFYDKSETNNEIAEFIEEKYDLKHFKEEEK